MTTFIPVLEMLAHDQFDSARLCTACRPVKLGEISLPGAIAKTFAAPEKMMPGDKALRMRDAKSGPSNKK